MVGGLKLEFLRTQTSLRCCNSVDKVGVRGVCGVRVYSLHTYVVHSASHFFKNMPCLKAFPLSLSDQST